jgi:hypothetical protein
MTPMMLRDFGTGDQQSRWMEPLAARVNWVGASV